MAATKGAAAPLRVNVSGRMTAARNAAAFAVAVDGAVVLAHAEILFLHVHRGEARARPFADTDAARLAEAAALTQSEDPAPWARPSTTSSTTSTATASRPGSATTPGGGCST